MSDTGQKADRSGDTPVSPDAKRELPVVGVSQEDDDGCHYAGPSGELCRNCYFFEPVEQECRRTAPQAQMYGVQAADLKGQHTHPAEVLWWPNVKPDMHWCGEFKPRPGAASEADALRERVRELERRLDAEESYRQEQNERRDSV